MLRPVRMTLVNVMLLKEDEPVVLHVLAEEECMQVHNARLHKGEESLAAIDTRSAALALEGLRSRMDQVAKELGLGKGDVDESLLRVDPQHIAAAIEREFAPLEKEAAAFAARIAESQRARDRADLVSWTVAGLANVGADVDTIVEARYSAIELGALPLSRVLRVMEIIALGGHRVFNLGHLGDRALVCAVTSPDRRVELADILDAARFERIAIGKDLVIGGKPAAEINEEAMWETRERLTEAGLALKSFTKEHGDVLRKLRREVDINTKLLEAMNDFLEGSYTCLVTGWVPTERVDELSSQLARRCDGRTSVSRIGEGVVDSGNEKLEPPTLLRNAAFVRPFQALVEFYGSPAYDGIDPTIFVAFTFTFMFGAMFGDLGQGIVLALLGLAAWHYGRKGSTLETGGAILAWCGTSASVFGVVYGTAFGFESEKWALWQAPMKNPGAFLVAGVILGVIVINMGLLVNLAQRIWARKYKEAVFGEWGATTLLFYWGVVGLFYVSATGKGAVTPWVVLGVLAPPLLATTFGMELADWITRKGGEHELAGFFVRPMELLTGSLTNTVSFMRVSAFAINHGALMVTVFIFADMFGGPGVMGSISSWANIVVGNITVMCVEGVIVFVQVLRLHYYEFFSKFFQHQGRPFEPLSLKAGRSGL